MTDNIFDRLRKLLETSGPVNWELAAGNNVCACAFAREYAQNREI